VDSVRDMDITIDHHLKFDTHISLIVHKGVFRSRLLLRCFSSRNDDCLKRVTCVRPVLEYCSPGQWWSQDIFFWDRDIGQDRNIETWDEPRHFGFGRDETRL